MAKGTINIYDYIGNGGIEAKDVLNILDGFKSNDVTEIEVRINSPGGSIFEGFSIFNQLRDFQNVTTVIDGIAASIASIIALSGNAIKAYKNSYLFIHNPWSLAIGDTNDMKKLSGDLDKFRNTIIELYKSKTGKSDEELKEFCNNSTFLTSSEALELGFIDEIIDNYPNSKSFVALYSDINGEVSLNDPENQSSFPVTEPVAEHVEAQPIDITEIHSLIKEVRVLLDSIYENQKETDDNVVDFNEELIPVLSAIDLSETEKLLDSKIESGELLPSLKKNFMNILTRYKQSESDEFISAVKEFFNLFTSGSNLLEDDIAVKPEKDNTNYNDEYELEAVDKDSLAIHSIAN